MELKDLTAELRKGGSWQMATERTLRMPVTNKALSMHENWDDKSTMGDDTLVRVASTCGDCGRSVPMDEIHKVVALARDLKSFLKIINTKIEHKQACSHQ